MSIYIGRCVGKCSLNVKKAWFLYFDAWLDFFLGGVRNMNHFLGEKMINSGFKKKIAKQMLPCHSPAEEAPLFPLLMTGQRTNSSAESLRLPVIGCPWSCLRPLVPYVPGVGALPQLQPLPTARGPPTHRSLRESLILP